MTTTTETASTISKVSRRRDAIRNGNRSQGINPWAVTRIRWNAEGEEQTSRPPHYAGPEGLPTKHG